MRIAKWMLAAAAFAPLSGAWGQALQREPAQSHERDVPIAGGLRTPIARGATEERERGAGIAADPGREAQQLRDLNAMSRELAPSAPVPAPEVERSTQRR